ncbi:histidine kinase [uncultured Treponema sp.]|uniref:sensor histidine kinase n=1 Tax=uncultured Treponema sp. TaxID=162155 RepID=UPI0025E01E9C|nr:histidine kinase [uncultured Treponema sp.]
MKLAENKSLRWKIMASIIAAFLIMSASLALTMLMEHYVLKSVGEAYKSNSELNVFANDLARLENSLELYIEYRTFESIDAYYASSARVEDLCDAMQDSPSTNEVRQKEYVVNQLAQSFLYYSSKAVAERRANSTSGNFYLQSLECYRFLLEEIQKLNILYMQNNAEFYAADRNNINLLFKVYAVFFALFFVFILALLNLLIGKITRPLAEISSVALRVAQQDFDVPLFNKKSHDEIGNICRAFDRMIISIREYIDKIWEKARTENELRERQMEMQALYADAQLKAFQSQINPHFLFNTLNTGAQLAMMEGADKTCFFIEQTSDFFRYNIAQKEDASIDDELGLVDNFVYIMKVRFGKRLEFVKNIPEHKFSQRLPAMTLQPLVENCIQHGLQNSMGKVFLSVKETDGFVEILVGDNGSKFDSGVREEILKAAKSGGIKSIASKENSAENKNGEHTGIGLINVFSRLRIYFHRDDVFDIFSGDDSEMKFLIRIPNV